MAQTTVYFIIPYSLCLLNLTTLGLILCVSLAGNVLFAWLILKDRHLHRAPYYLLLDLCLADGLRSLACFPFVMLSVHSGAGAWPHGPLSCKVLAFFAVLFCFHAAFLLFCVGVTRYMAIAHHRFYAKRMTGWTCLAVVCMVWTLSMAMAFPPVFDVGTYKFIREEEQCIFEHRYVKANDTLGFMLMLATVIAATHLVYVKLLFFIHSHRKMKPAQLVPAISQNWTFHGPGATGQAAANWTAGFGRGPTPPTLVGIRQNATHSQIKRLLVLEEFKMEKRICKMFYMITLLFLLLWSPYIVACYLRVFIKASTIPQVYLTISVWMTFAQAGVNPILCFIFNRELRVCFRAHFLCCQSIQNTQGIILCDLKNFGV
uniref:G protein-coupled receptor 27 n=1 Tax=Salvator merianae TaxID=96440 RepID=A0A8D0B653_SALMN